MHFYGDDVVMDVGGGVGEIRGRDAIVGVITDFSHSKLTAEGMTQMPAQPYIRVGGSHAIAVGYLQIIAHEQLPTRRATEGTWSAGQFRAEPLPLTPWLPRH